MAAFLFVVDADASVVVVVDEASSAERFLESVAEAELVSLVVAVAVADGLASVMVGAKGFGVAEEISVSTSMALPSLALSFVFVLLMV